MEDQLRLTISDTEPISEINRFFTIKLSQSYSTVNELLTRLGINALKTVDSPQGTPHIIAVEPSSKSQIEIIVLVRLEKSVIPKPVGLDEPLSEKMDVNLYPREECCCLMCEDSCQQCSCDNMPFVCPFCGRPKLPITCPECGSRQIRTPPKTPYSVLALTGHYPSDNAWKRRWMPTDLPKLPPWEVAKTHPHLVYHVDQDIHRRGRRYIRMTKSSDRTLLEGFWDSPEYEEDLTDIVEAFRNNVWECRKCGHRWQRYYDERITPWIDY